MSGESDPNKEFMEQLRLQELYGQRKEDGSDPYTYTDPEDGTVYDWDHEKKAWFPKVRAFFDSQLFFLKLFLVYIELKQLYLINTVKNLLLLLGSFSCCMTPFWPCFSCWRDVSTVQGIALTCGVLVFDTATILL